MPQLDPSPWFAILVFSWLTFLTIIPQKVIKHAFHNDPASQAAKKPATKAWDWPWH